MLNKCKNFLNYNILLTIIVAPYIVYITSNSSFIFPFIYLIICLFIVEIIYQKINLKSKLFLDLNILTVPTLIIFFYFDIYIIIYSKLYQFLQINLFENVSFIIFICWIITCLFYYLLFFILRYKLIYLNLFFCIFSLVIFINDSFQKNKYPPLQSHLITLASQKNNPVILIILDEYASPDELFKNFRDSTIYNLNNILKYQNWHIKSKQFSYNLITANSLSSLFNYNYKCDDSKTNYSNSIRNLRKSKLIFDLQRNGIKTINYGIFDLNNYNALNKIYYYEKEFQKSTFIKQFFSHTIIGNSSKRNIQLLHNKYIVENGFKKINTYSKKNTFTYIHILMPHSPYEYIGRRKFKPNSKSTSIYNYLDYWRFSNQLVFENLINPLVKTNKYKIILTGDHGYRESKVKINPNLTFSAFYGFDSTQVNKIKSVQDIGSLIIASY